MVAVVSAENLQGIGRDRLPGLLGMEVLEVAPGSCRIGMDAGQRHHAPNGYLHGGAVVALADTACGYGCVASLPEGASGFTTIELKTNFVGTALDGRVVAEARLAHGGRTTQVWDAVVSDEGSGRAIAFFRCTQLLLRAR
jgi:1,4-dihydroxy-2-naphthoyl-CoA hydrolase